MAVDTLGTLSMIRLNGSAVNIFGIDNVQISEGITKMLAHGAGEVDASFVTIPSIQPMISVTATELAKVLAVIGINGLCVGSAQTCTSVDFYFALIGECSPRLGSTSHVKVTMNEGLIIPTQLQASQGQKATLGLEFHATYDGSNNPLAFATGQSIPATATITEQFTVGPVNINGTELTSIQQTTVNFGINLIKMAGSGDVYPTYMGIGERNPSAEFKTTKLASINTFGLTGTAQGSTDSVIYFRKYAKNGTLTANGTAEHVSFSVDDGIITCDSMGGGNNQSNDATVTITPTYDGSNAIFAISTATAIT